MKKSIIKNISLGIACLLGVGGSIAAASIFNVDKTFEEVRADGNIEFIIRMWNPGKKEVSSIPSTCDYYTPVTSTTTSWTNENWYVVNEDVTIDECITVSGEANLILCNNATLTINSCIVVNSENTLNIYSQSGDTGALNVTGDGEETLGPAGIGGGEFGESGGTINIHGGDITANSSYGAGIGGGAYGNGGNITIYGGTINATSEAGAAIGGGPEGEGGTITIYGGNIEAVSEDMGAGIGGGDHASGGNITIHDGEVTAKGNSGASIGGGSEGAGGTITINGGTVYATNLRNGAGIGGGQVANGGTINITGGTIYATGGAGASGIGGGDFGNYGGTGGNVTISGGTVYATGGSHPDGIGFGIGAGKNGTDHGSLDITEASLGVYGGDTANPTTERTKTEYDVERWQYMTVKSNNLEPVNYVSRSWDSTNKVVVETPSTCDIYKLVKSDSTSWENGKWYVLNESIEINNCIEVTGTVNLILCDDATLTVPNGINVSVGNSLNIFDQTNGTGKIIATGEYGAAGIGGGLEAAGGTVSIYGGIVDATSESEGAGIGGGRKGAGGEVIIYGGNVTATGGSNGAGIGGGYEAAGGEVIIYGGNVTATGEYGAAGIGGGFEAAGGTVSIYGGTLTATGGSNGAGIGGGYKASAGGIVSISGGTVSATGGESGAGIGGGYSGTGGIVNISGGTVTATGGYAGAGIGGGSLAAGGEVNISVGTLTATGGYGGAGIGGGYGYAGGNVNISGGTVTATGGTDSVGIGAGKNCTDHGSLVINETSLGLFGGTTENPTTRINKENNDYARYRYMAVKVPHEHNWSYSAEGATITASCSNSDCPVTEGLTLELQASASLTYDGSVKAATFKAGYSEEAFPNPTIKYYQGTSEVASCVNAGTYTAKVTFGTATAELEFTIAKATPTPVTDRNATYGQSLSDITLPEGWSWNSSTDKVGNAGNRVHKATFTPEDLDNYNTVEQNVNVIVAKANPVVTPPTIKDGLVYDGTAQDLINAGSTTGGTLKYSLDGETYSTSIPQGTNAGTYPVYYKVFGDDNYNDTVVQIVNAVIAKTSGTYTAPTAKGGLEYNTTAQALINAGTGTGGTLMYRLSTESIWSDVVPTGVEPGTYTVEYYFKGDSNHLDSEVYSIENIGIDKASFHLDHPENVLVPNVLTYNEQSQGLASVNDTEIVDKYDGLATMEYSFDEHNWSSEMLSKTNAGTYTVYFRLVPTDTDHYTITRGNTWKTEVTISKADPSYTVPTDLKVLHDKTLSDVVLPTGWTWDEPTTNVGSELGNKVFKATFTPTDTDNYNIIEHVDITVQVTEHEHNWSYTASGATITASCSNPECPVTEGLTLELEAPTSLTYDGNAKAAILKAGYSEEAFATPTISYYKDGVEVEECINAGTYEARVIIGGVTAIKEFTVAQATPTPEVPAGLVATYGDKLSSATLPNNWEWKNPNDKVGNAGNREHIAIYTPADPNYKAIEETLTVSVAKANPTYTLPTDIEIYINETLSNVTLPSGFSWMDESIKASSLGENTFKVRYTPVDTANYNVVDNIDLKVNVEWELVDPSSNSASIVIDGADEAYSTDISVEVEVKTDISVEQKRTEYAYLATKDFVKPNEDVYEIYGIKLIRTTSGVEEEIQPSDIKPGTKIIVSVAIPEELVGKDFRLLHIHNSDDITEVTNYAVSKDGKTLTVEVDRLSEFAFIGATDKDNGFIYGSTPIWALILLIIFSIILLVGIYYLYRLIKDRNDNSNNGDKSVKTMSITFISPVLLAYSGLNGIIIAFIIVAALSVIIWASNLYLFISNKKKKEKLIDANNSIETKEDVKPVEEAISDSNEDEIEVVTIKDEKGNIFNIRYIKSFLAKLIQSPAETKSYYEELKNEVLSYKGTHSRISWHFDSVNAGRNYVLKFAIRGKTLCLYLPLDADNFIDTKYKVEKVEVKKYQDVPCLYRIKNDRRLGYAKELIATVASSLGLSKGEEQHEIYSNLPYEDNKPLIARGLIKEQRVQVNKPAARETEILSVVTNDDGDEVITKKDSKGNIFQIRYIKSFTAKLCQAEQELKDYYNELKNHALSYKKANSRVSWHFDSINVGKNQVIKFAIRGKTLCLYFALNADDYADSKYKVEKVESKKYEDVPCLYRIKNDRRRDYAKDLIDTVMANVPTEKGKESNEEFRIPFEETKVLLEKGLIKEVKTKVEAKEVIKSITVEEADKQMSDEKADASIELDTVHKRRIGKKEIINIDTLSNNFDNGDEVTIEALIAKKLVPSKTGYVKLLARGTLDKKLIVCLNDYSLQAVKMIMLLGGQVKRIK